MYGHMDLHVYNYLSHVQMQPRACHVGTTHSFNWDLCVIGGGISGLVTAWRVKQAMPSASVCVFERGPSAGGRVRTNYAPDNNTVLYERGPWRLNLEHRLVLELVEELGLTTSPLPSTENSFNLISTNPGCLGSPSTAPISSLSSPAVSTWARNVVGGGVLYADHSARATGYGPQLQYEAFGGNAYRSSSPHENAHFVRVNEGLSAIVARLVLALEATGVSVFTNTKVTNISFTNGGYTTTVTERIDNAFSGRVHTSCKCCLALPPHYITGFDIYEHLKLSATQVSTVPLVHVYAEVDPRYLSSEVGFGIVHSGLGSQVISSNADNNWMQIAYAGGENANAIQQLNLENPATLKALLLTEVSSALSDIRGDDPSRCCVDEFFGTMDVCYWRHAVHTWAPLYGQALGTASWLATVAPHPLKLPGLVIVGEAFSLVQGWMEGALQTSKAAVRELTRKTTLLLNHLPVIEHLPCEWIEYDGWLIDVTEWRKVHPGSARAIENHIGEDVTELFQQVNHTEHAYGILGALRVGVRNDQGEWVGFPGQQGGESGWGRRTCVTHQQAPRV